MIEVVIIKLLYEFFKLIDNVNYYKIYRENCFLDEDNYSLI